jgi:hypothetical protein
MPLKGRTQIEIMHREVAGGADLGVKYAYDVRLDGQLVGTAYKLLFDEGFLLVVDGADAIVGTLREAVAIAARVPDSEAGRALDQMLVQAVERGARCLDRHMPDWRSSVDLVELHGGECVLVQLYGGDFAEACKRLGVLDEYNYGFDVEEEVSSQAALRAMWESHIA